MNSLSFLDKIHSKRILVAPLNWGLGHVARCIPIVKTLQKQNHIVLASDGASLSLLRLEFPELTIVELPAYQISYGGKGGFMWGMIKQTPKITLAISKEMAETEDIVKAYKIDMIISDHRLGCYSDICHSVIMAHQIQIKGNIGITGILGSKLNKYFINRFDECWIPDYKLRSMSLAGDLSEADGLKAYRYIGPLSRLKQRSSQLQDLDIVIILSGPEPARSHTEQLLLRAIAPMNLKTVIVSGKEGTQKRIGDNIEQFPLCTSLELNDLIERSKMIISRSGYTTIMDMEILQKKAILIPTPGQTEQEYLAEYLSNRAHLRFIDEKNINTNSLSMAIQELLDTPL